MESFWGCNSLTAAVLAHLHGFSGRPVTLVDDSAGLPGGRW